MGLTLSSYVICVEPTRHVSFIALEQLILGKVCMLRLLELICLAMLRLR